MKTNLSARHLGSTAGRLADDILRLCVHCGFCNATCPTYQLTGDELDGPRGRIYQIKEVLEGNAASASTRLHLDRCLSCRGCETTCPSGVAFARLLDTGRSLVEQQVPRGPGQRLYRALLWRFLSSPLFAAALACARAVRPVLPARLKAVVPERHPVPGPVAQAAHARRVILVGGCVQRALQPSIDAAAIRVFDQCGISTLPAPATGCCGALSHHLNAQQAALAQIRRNIDAWTPLLDAGAEAITMTASGCGVMIRDYRYLLQDEPDYASRAERIAAAYRDPAEVLDSMGTKAPGHSGRGRIVFHPPCSLQHGLRVTGTVERFLADAGYELLPCDETYLCCGAAGTYSITQKDFSKRLRQRKLDQLEAARPDLIVTANIGCQTHLQAGTEVPVRHWLELLGSDRDA